MSEQALIRRINRRLPEHHKLHKARRHEQFHLGNYYVFDLCGKCIVEYGVEDLEEYYASVEAQLEAERIEATN